MDIYKSNVKNIVSLQGPNPDELITFELILQTAYYKQIRDRSANLKFKGRNHWYISLSFLK